MKTARSLDPPEVAYYQRLAHTWRDSSGSLWPIHTLYIQRMRYPEQKIAARFETGFRERARFSGLRVLDIGCGGGVLSEALARLGADVAERNIRGARDHAVASDLNIDYRLGSAEDLAGRGECFDVVLNMEAVEHVADPGAFMADCNALVRPGGMMFTATINCNPLAWLTAVFGAEYVLRWLPRGMHHWRKLRRPRKIEALLVRGRLQVTERTGVLVNPFTRQMRLSRFTGINYMLAAVRAAEIHAIPNRVFSQASDSRQETAR